MLAIAINISNKNLYNPKVFSFSHMEPQEKDEGS